MGADRLLIQPLPTFLFGLISRCTFRFCPAVSIDGGSDWILPYPFAGRSDARSQKMMLVVTRRGGFRGALGLLVRTRSGPVRRGSGEDRGRTGAGTRGWWIKNFHSLLSLCTALVARLLSALLLVAAFELSGRIRLPIDTDPLPGAQCHAARDTFRGKFVQLGAKRRAKLTSKDDGHCLSTWPPLFVSNPLFGPVKTTQNF